MIKSNIHPLAIETPNHQETRLFKGMSLKEIDPMPSGIITYAQSGLGSLALKL
jgi:hypothetical protein